MPRPVDLERSAARREAITVAAADLFARHGFENTTATDIARAAGLSSGTVFYYFTDKRAVFRSIFERDIPVLRELVDRALACDDPVAAVLTMVDELAADALDPNASGILVELLRQIDRDPELLRVVTGNDAILLDGFTTLIERGIEAGAVDPGLDAREAAAWIVHLVDAAYLGADPARDPRPMLRRLVTRFLAPPTADPPTGEQG
ncbi:TetR family transcriptional regulator [Prauserella shujinwangii]|uniref:TetR family transcriptional regulator n=1 Tax=Prauserella shujinwangii TaxID=1453103 RepID=A0A2T0LMU2_9PSEU|nr:TetR/AcrR family transcriptional regulator [Prauserella shujinwangii]PRX44508.1 TetR family transcriptional regulator [Prauserella shujinwangii]